MSRIQEALSANKNRVYPFVDDSDTGMLPSWMLLDLRVMDAGGRGTTVEMTGVSVDTGTVTLSFAYSGSTFAIPVELGSGIVVGRLSPEDDLSVKYAVYGGGSEYELGAESGEYAVSARLLPSLVVSLSPGRNVDGISGKGGTIGGTVHVMDGYNTTAHVVGGKIRVEVGNGIGLGTYCAGEDETFDCSKAFMFLNGQHANTSGNINIVGGSGVSVQTGRTIAVDGKYMPAITVTVAKGVDELLGPIYLWKRPEDEEFKPAGFPVGLQVVRAYDGFVKYRGVLSEEDGVYSFEPYDSFQGATVEAATGEEGHTTLRISWRVDTYVDSYSERIDIPGTPVSVVARFSDLQTDPKQEIVAVTGLDDATIVDGYKIHVPVSASQPGTVYWGEIGDLHTKEWVLSHQSDITDAGLEVPADSNYDRYGYCHNFYLASDAEGKPTAWASFQEEPDDVLEVRVSDVEPEEGVEEGAEEDEPEPEKSFEVVGLSISGDDAMLQYGVEWAEPGDWGDLPTPASGD